MKMHMLICLFISMLVGKKKGEIVIKIKDSYENTNEVYIYIYIYIYI
jgi:hypothetical protein